MKSVRFSNELERKLMKLAELEQKNQSAVIRQAIEREYERITENRLDVEIDDLIGKLSLGGGRARETGGAFLESVRRDSQSS
ncbi:MAG: ribbon-helix-helix protein, CopG family [bacterium]